MLCCGCRPENLWLLLDADAGSEGEVCRPGESVHDWQHDEEGNRSGQLGQCSSKPGICHFLTDQWPTSHPYSL